MRLVFSITVILPTPPLRHLNKKEADEFYQATQAGLLRYLTVLINPAQHDFWLSPEDIAQEAYLSFFQRPRPFSFHERRAILFKIAHYRYVDQRRSDCGRVGHPHPEQHPASKWQTVQGVHDPESAEGIEEQGLVDFLRSRDHQVMTFDPVTVVDVPHLRLVISAEIKKTGLDWTVEELGRHFAGDSLIAHKASARLVTYSAEHRRLSCYCAPSRVSSFA